MELAKNWEITITPNSQQRITVRTVLNRRDLLAYELSRAVEELVEAFVSSTDR